MCVRERGGGGVVRGDKVGVGEKGTKPRLDAARASVCCSLSLAIVDAECEKKGKKSKELGQRPPRPLRSFSSQPPSLNRNRMSRSRRPSGWSSVSPSEEGKRPPSEMRFSPAPEKSPRFRSVSRFAVVSLRRSGHGAPKSRCSRVSRPPLTTPNTKHYAHRWNPASWPRSGRASRP